MKVLEYVAALVPLIVMVLFMRRAIARVLRAIVGALILSLFISGCSTTSNKIEKAPCACEFTPFEVDAVEGHDRA